MSIQLIRPAPARRLDIRCNVGDAIVANLAVHIVFFFKRHLDTGPLADAFARALTDLPVFAGRMTFRAGLMRIRCEGQGVPFASVSSGTTLDEAIRSVSEDRGLWLVDRVNGATARWGLGPLCRVRVTHLADGASAIGVSWHHVVGDMQTMMLLMNAWAGAAAGRPPATPLLVGDRAAYLDEHLPADGAREPGVRCLGLVELARSALYLVKDGRRQRTLSVYFGEDEITRMRAAHGSQMWLSANDVVCAHVSEALMEADPTADRRILAIAVDVRRRCGLDPMLVGNVITTLNLDLRRGEGARSVAERIRHQVDHFVDEHCDMRTNQRFLDTAGAWRGTRCVSAAFDPVRWNPIVSNQSGFGVERLQFQDTLTSYCALVMKSPVAGLGSLMEGMGGLGLVFQITLAPKVFDAMSSPAVQERMHRFRRADDDIPRMHREAHG